MPTLNEYSKACYDNAVSKGFYATINKAVDLLEAAGDDKGANELRAVWGLSRLMLINTELSEAAEELREPGKMSAKIKEKLGDDVNLLSFDEELADVQIRLFDLAGSSGIDLDRAVNLKMKANSMRKPMHGGKLA